MITPPKSDNSLNSLLERMRKSAVDKYKRNHRKPQTTMERVILDEEIQRNKLVRTIVRERQEQF